MHKTPKYQLLLSLILLVACIVIAKNYEVDFKTVYAVATVKNIQDSYIQQSTYNAGRYFYGPISLLLIRPFGFFSYEVSRWLWISLQTLCFIVFFNFLYRFYPDLKNSFLFWLGSFIFLINPIHGNFQSNNIQLMLMAAFMYSESLSTRGKKSQFASGFIISLLASIKIFPAFIGLFYLITKKRPVILGLVCGAVFALFSPILFYGLETTLNLYRDFYTNVSTYENDNELTRPDILSLASMVTTFTEGKIFYGKQYLASALFIGISTVFFVLAHLLRKFEETKFPLWTLGLLLMAVLTPSARVHFWVFCIPAFCEIAYHIKKRNLLFKPTGIALLACLFMVAFTTETVVGKSLNDYFEYIRIPLLGLFLLAALLLLRIKKLATTNLANELSSHT